VYLRHKQTGPKVEEEEEEEEDDDGGTKVMSTLLSQKL
jgi:hypothetical protein